MSILPVTMAKSTTIGPMAIRKSHSANWKYKTMFIDECSASILCVSFYINGRIEEKAISLVQYNIVVTTDFLFLRKFDF